MPEEWTTMPATEVEPGATIRLANGHELEVTRVERDFLGVGLTAFIEDTPRQWFKAPMPGDTVVEVRTSLGT